MLYSLRYWFFEIGICPCVFCIFPHYDCQLFHYGLEYPCNALIKQYTGPEVVDAPLTPIFIIGKSSWDILFHPTGCHYIVYEFVPQCDTTINQEARRELVDTQWTLIFRLTHAAYRYCLCAAWQPSPCLRISATCRHIDYPTCKAKYHWSSIDTQLQHGVAYIVAYKGCQYVSYV
jgi:hypothetical protein